MDNLQALINKAETYFIQVLQLKDQKPTKKAIDHFGLTIFDPLNPRKTESEEVYFEADVYDVLIGTYRLPELKAENCCSQLISLQPIIYFFEGGIVLIALYTQLISSDKANLSDWLRFIESFRWVQMRTFQEKTWKDKMVKPIETIPNWVKNANQELTARQIILMVFECVFGRAMDEKASPLFRNYNKVFVSNFIDLQGGISDENFYHILFVDRPIGFTGYSDPLPSPDTVKQELESNTYKRWRHQNQYFGFSGYSFCFVLTPNEQRIKSISSEQFQNYFENRYHILYLIAILELSVQTRFIFELNDALKEIEKSKKAESLIYSKISELRNEQLKINANTWFGRITIETQPRELFNIARQVLQTDKLHDEIVEKLAQLDDHLNAKTQVKLSQRMDLLQRILTPLLLISALFTLFQIPSIEEVFNSWFDLIKLPHWIGILLTTLLLTATGSWLIDIFVWRKSK